VATDIYDHFERAERKAESERMAGVFDLSRTSASTGSAPEGTVRDSSAEAENGRICRPFS
jgi:hypothetical protein